MEYHSLTRLSRAPFCRLLTDRGFLSACGSLEVVWSVKEILTPSSSNDFCKDRSLVLLFSLRPCPFANSICNPRFAIRNPNGCRLLSAQYQLMRQAAVPSGTDERSNSNVIILDSQTSIQSSSQSRALQRGCRAGDPALTAVFGSKAAISLRMLPATGRI